MCPFISIENIPMTNADSVPLRRDVSGGAGNGNAWVGVRQFFGSSWASHAERCAAAWGMASGAAGRA
jgi:hypothetical protein